MVRLLLAKPKRPVGHSQEHLGQRARSTLSQAQRKNPFIPSCRTSNRRLGNPQGRILVRPLLLEWLAGTALPRQMPPVELQHPVPHILRRRRTVAGAVVGEERMSRVVVHHPLVRLAVPVQLRF